MSGCGSSPSTPPTTHRHAAAAARTRPGATTVTTTRVPRLRVAGTLGHLPAARSGSATATFGSRVAVLGGLSAAGGSTDTVSLLDATGASTVSAPLPSAVHDAAAASVAGHLLVLGGGQTEGSDRIVEVLPGPAHLVGRLPQALSDLVAVPIGDVAYVIGGWNGSLTNRNIYAVSADGTVTRAARLPLGVRYGAAAALGKQAILAGGETSSGTPTARAFSFDPNDGRIARLPDLPSPTDHAAGAVLGGRFYLLGGLRRGVLSDAVLSWAPGESRWTLAGHLPTALADFGAVSFDGGIVVLGGRGTGGAVASVTLLRR